MVRTLEQRQIQYAKKVKEYVPEANAKFLKQRLSKAKDFGYKCILSKEVLECIAQWKPVPASMK